MLFVSRLSLFGLLVLVFLPMGPALAQSPPEETEGVRIFEPAYYDEFDPVSALQLVFRTPGFSPQESDGGRGLSGVRSNILIDGQRPPPKGQSIRQQLREMPVSGVQYIELIDAGARLDVDMQGYPQVVNVITVENAPAYYEVTTQMHRAGTGDVNQNNQRNVEVEATGSFSFKGHEFTMRGDARDESNRSPADFVSIDPANPEQRISSLNRWDQENNGVQLNAAFQLPSDSSLDFSTRFNSWTGVSTPISLDVDPSGPDLITQSSSNDNDQNDLSAEYRRPFGDNSTVMVAYVDAKEEQISESSLVDDTGTSSSISDRESGERAARVLITQPLSQRLTIRTEASTAFNYFDGGFRLFDNGVEIPIEGSDSRVEEDRNAIDASVDWGINDKWTFQSTVGFESYEITTRDATSGLQTDPKGEFSISYRPRDRTTISFESTRQIGQLSFGQFLASSSLSSEIITAGAVTLEPERSWRHAAVYDRRFSDVGQLRFELARQEVDNPVRQVALSDSLIVAQNTSPRVIDQARAQISYPFEKFGREDLILGVQARVRQSDTIDPVTGEQRPVSGVQTRDWSIELRRDPGEGRLAWNFFISDRTDGRDYSVRRIGERDSTSEWGASVEWEPIDGLRIRAQLEGPRTTRFTSLFFAAVRTPGLNPSFVATTTTRTDRGGSLTVEWRRMQRFEIRASLSTRPSVTTLESLTPFGDPMGTFLAREFARTPRATLRFRFFR
jgi:hypothetical protein